MIDVHTHSSVVHDAPRRASRDPTDTHVLRRRFAGALTRRWRTLMGLVRQAVGEQDMFALANLTPTGVLVLQSSSRLASLQTWFDYAMNDVLLGQGGLWMGGYVRAAYARGRERAERLTPGSVATVEATDRADTVTRATVIELQGIMEAVSQLVAREMFSSLSKRMRPAPTARAMVRHMQKVGVVRSQAMAHTMVVRAHAMATLDVFEARGVRRVGVLPETVPPVRVVTDARRVRRRRELVNVLTAGDDDVCPRCEELAEFGPYTIAQAIGLIPAHPRCRCAFVPADEGGDDE